MTNTTLLSYVGKQVTIKLKSGKSIFGVLEKWYERDGFYSLNIRNVKHNIHWWDVVTIK